MLNSARMWELHHIRMHVLFFFVMNGTSVCVCVEHTLALLHHAAFEKPVSFCIYRSAVDFLHPCAFPSFALYLHPNVSAILPRVIIFPSADVADPKEKQVSEEY